MCLYERCEIRAGETMLINKGYHWVISENLRQECSLLDTCFIMSVEDAEEEIRISTTSIVNSILNTLMGP